MAKDSYLGPTISDKILWEFEKVRLKFPFSRYTMLRTHDIA